MEDKMQIIQSANIMDMFHQGQAVCSVPKISKKRKRPAFEKFRPEAGKYMDYSISQTETKMDYGTTNVHVVQTRAEYVEWPPNVEKPPTPVSAPVLPKPKKHKSHGRGPCWEFLDEIRVREIEIRQEQYKIQAKERQAYRKKMAKLHKFGLHEILLYMVGPEWYQELAPKQICAIDMLQDAITKDIADKSHKQVKSVMAMLGLVLRPNPKNLETALAFCCGNAVEFLLILYQISNKNRKQYSLNDRLLLSGVVHLTMRDTLREMHVRIPSPPPPIKKPPPSLAKKPPPKKYKSPYLEPYTFKPEQRKEKGEYKNTYKQYPESIYFDYIDELKKRKDDFGGIIQGLLDSEDDIMMPDRPLTQEEDLTLELLRAQESYEKLNTTNISTPLLLRANLKPDCKITSSDPELILNTSLVQHISQLAELDAALEDTELPKTDITVAVQVKVISEYNEKCEFQEQKVEYYVDVDEQVDPTYMQRIAHGQKILTKSKETFLNNGVALDAFGKPMFCLGGVIAPYWKAPGQEEYEAEIEKIQHNFHAMKHSFLIDGVHIGQDGLPVYGISATFPEDDYDKYIQQGQEVFQYSTTMFLISGVCINKEGKPVYGIQGQSATKLCKCELMMAKQAYEAKRAAERDYGITMEQFKKEELKRMQWEKELQEMLMKLEDESYRKMRQVKSSHEELVAVKKRDSPCCLCRKAVEDFIQLPRCTCELCQKDKQEARKVFIVEGTAIKTGDPIHIITGMAEEKECRCLERYRQQVAAYDERQTRHNAMLDLKNLEKKYVINGVRMGPNGEPIYILSGLIPPRKECPCREYNIREQQRIKNMPAPLVPDRRYIIGGIQATPNGNVWIVSGVNPLPDCDCMKIYDAFMDRHSDCMALYEAYVHKMQKDVEEHLEEFGGPLFKEADVDEKEEEELASESQGDETKSKFYYKVSQPHLIIEVTSDTCVQGLAEVTKNELANVDIEEEKMRPHSSRVDFDPDRTHFVMIKQADKTESEEMLLIGAGEELVEEESRSDEDFMFSTVDDEHEVCLNLIVQKKKRVCLCLPENEGLKADCTCAERRKKKKKSPPPPRDYKRYVLLRKLPCNYELQVIILKQVLATLAEDGYPLAKLPDCWLLPHFKQWWRWRCNIFTSQEDRGTLYKFSKKFWNHTEKCNERVRLPKLPIDRDLAKEMTWGRADYVKAMTSKAINNYYSKVKQAHISDGREYFPTLCDYDLPTKNFRHCLFAYIPWKEEESFAQYPWHVHEYKDMRNAKVCL